MSQDNTDIIPMSADEYKAVDKRSKLLAKRLEGENYPNEQFLLMLDGQVRRLDVGARLHYMLDRTENPDFGNDADDFHELKEIRKSFEELLEVLRVIADNIDGSQS